jgi:hypothetical protein
MVLRLMPLALSVLLIAWTAAVVRVSYYGSWHIYPALLVLPVVLLLHGISIARGPRRRPLVIFAIVHLMLLCPLWIGCLMLISKDSF